MGKIHCFLYDMDDCPFLDKEVSLAKRFELFKKIVDKCFLGPKEVLNLTNIFRYAEHGKKWKEHRREQKEAESLIMSFKEE